MVEQEKTGRAQAVVLRDVLRLRATSSTRRKDYVEDPRAAFVDYDTFLEKYWAHLPYGLRDPRLSEDALREPPTMVLTVDHQVQSWSSEKSWVRFQSCHCITARLSDIFKG